ncbi:MAG: N-acetylmuramoyl-L-alanine amidase [Oscillospiraceae bacterium]
MSKNKKIVLIIVSVLVWAIIVVGFVLAKMGILPFFKNDKASQTSGNITTQAKKEEIRKKNARPEKVNGVYLLAGTDFAIAPELAITEVKTGIDTALKEAVEYGFNTIYISAISEKNPIILGTGKEKFDVIEYISKKAHESKLYVVSMIDYNDAMVVGENIKSNDKLIKKMAKYDVDALLLSNIMSFNSAAFTGDPATKATAINDAVKVISETAKNANKVIEVGAEVSPVWAHTAHDAAGSKTSSYYESLVDAQLDTRLWVQKNYVDFVLVDSDNSMSRANANYKTSMTWWNDIVDGTKVALFAKHRTDLICTDNATWSSSDELARQFMATTELKNCMGNSFYNLSSFKADKGSSTTRYLSYIKGELNVKNIMTDLIITNQTNTTIKTSESKISFTGTGDPSAPITLNGKAMERTEEGYFSVVVDLKAGKNVFTFANKGQSKTYTVIYTLDVIKSASPIGKVQGIGDTSIVIKAEALKGAKIYAKINGQTISMSIGSADESEDDLANTESMDYVTYVGTYKLPAATTSVQNLGKIKVYGSFNGHSDSAIGANVYVNALVAPPPDTSNGGSGTVLSGKIGVVSSTLAETFDGATLDGKYNPTFTPLPKGTYDFIVGEATIDKVKYYKLSSGRIVFASNFSEVASPPTLSMNKLSAVSAAGTGNVTKLKLKTDWWVPFNVQLNPQSYYKGYDSRVFNVASFTASYVDIVFYYTYAGEGTFDFSSSNVVRSAEWVNVGANGTSTLRLHLTRTGAFYGYEVTHDDTTGCFVLTIKNKPSALANYTVLLDPGHGGKDPGAIGAIINSQTGKNYTEAEVNLALATQVKQKLQALGVNVIMTRTGNTTMALPSRAAYITNVKPDLSVSIHNDSSSSSTATGTSAYYFRSYSFPLAKEVHDSLLTTWNTIYGRPIQDRKTNFYPFRIARIEVCPAILIECGFMSNPTEISKLVNPANQELLSAAITNGIVSYINKY